MKYQMVESSSNNIKYGDCIISQQEFDILPLYFKEIINGKLKLNDKIIINGKDFDDAYFDNVVATLVNIEITKYQMSIFVKCSRTVTYEDSNLIATFSSEKFGISDNVGYVFYTDDLNIMISAFGDVIDF